MTGLTVLMYSFLTIHLLLVSMFTTLRTTIIEGNINILD